MRIPSQRQPVEIKQRSLLEAPCAVCEGAGRVPWAVNVRSQGRRGSIEYQTCGACLGTGHVRTGTNRFA